MDNIKRRPKRPQSHAAGATAPRDESKAAESTDSTGITPAASARASDGVSKNSRQKISQPLNVKVLKTPGAQALSDDGFMLPEQHEIKFMQNLLGQQYEQLASTYKIQVERNGTKDNHRVVIYMETIMSSDSEINSGAQADSRLEQADPGAQAASMASAIDAGEPEEILPTNVKRKLPLSRTRAVLKKDSSSTKKARLDTQGSSLTSTNVELSNRKSELEAETPGRDGEEAAPVEEQVVKKPRFRKPKYRNMCPRDDKGCDRARCDFLHTDQWDYLMSEEYIEDGKPWQHYEPFIFTVRNLPYHPRMKLIH